LPFYLVDYELPLLNHISIFSSIFLHHFIRYYRKIYIIRNQRAFIELPKTNQEIVPDGLCVDKEGYVWSAQWNGWQVVRYSLKGAPLLRGKVPAQRVTSCYFGGENSDLRFITTARECLSRKILSKQTHAGDVFIYQTNTQGQISNYFGRSLISKDNLASDEPLEKY